MKSRRELKTFWRPRSMTNMPLTIAAPEKWKELDSPANADLILTVDIGRLSQSQSQTRLVSKAPVKCLAPEVIMAMLHGKRCASVQFLDNPSKCQSVKFKEKWRDRFFGIHVSDSFKSAHNGYWTVLRHVSVLDSAFSKFTMLSLSDYSRWSKDKKIKNQCHNFIPCQTSMIW